MKTTPTLKLIIVVAGMALIIAAQWRATSRLRHENQELKVAQEQAGQTRAEMEQATHAAAQRESEAQSLTAEVVALRKEVETVRQELEQARSSARQAGTSARGAPARPGQTAPGVPWQRPAQERRLFYMQPAVRTNLAPLPADHRYSFKTSGRVDDVELWSSITRDTVLAGPDWSPSEPLPLSFTDGERIARGELGKLVQDESSWDLIHISLSRPLDRGSKKMVLRVPLQTH